MVGVLEGSFRDEGRLKERGKVGTGQQPQLVNLLVWAEWAPLWEGHSNSLCSPGGSGTLHRPQLMPQECWDYTQHPHPASSPQPCECWDYNQHHRFPDGIFRSENSMTKSGCLCFLFWSLQA